MVNNMRSYSLIPALFVLFCLVGLVPNVNAQTEDNVANTPVVACPTTTVTGYYSGGDTIDLSGPSPTSAETALGVTYTYYWTVVSKSTPGGSGTPVTIADPYAKDISIAVDLNTPPSYYHATLLVTTTGATGCVATSCKLFQLVTPVTCTITGFTGPICVTNTTAATYRVANSPPSGMRRGWWVLASGEAAPTRWNDNRRLAEGDSVSINWHDQSDNVAGRYTVWTALFSTKNGNAPVQPNSICTLEVIVTPIPVSTFTST